MDENEALEQQVEPNGGETDWEAKYREALKHSRDWEARAKANKGAADELERIKAENMSEAERLRARAEKAEAELSRLESEKELSDAAQEISKQTDVPEDLLRFCKDSEAMEAFAAAYRSHLDGIVHAAPSAPRTRLVRGSETPVSNRDVFAELTDRII